MFSRSFLLVDTASPGASGKLFFRWTNMYSSRVRRSLHRTFCLVWRLSGRGRRLHGSAKSDRTRIAASRCGFCRKVPGSPPVGRMPFVAVVGSGRYGGAEAKLSFVPERRKRPRRALTASGQSTTISSRKSLVSLFVCRRPPGQLSRQLRWQLRRSLIPCRDPGIRPAAEVFCRPGPENHPVVKCSGLLSPGIRPTAEGAPRCAPFGTERAWSAARITRGCRRPCRSGGS